MPISDWTPSVGDVGALLRARTMDNVGHEVGTFNDDTRPTGEQVSNIVQQAARRVATVIGATPPTAVWADAKAVVVIGAACLVELTYFPEQINTSNSPYVQLKALYDDDLKALKLAVVAAGGSGDGSDDPDNLLEPSFAFPMTGDPYIIGRRTAW